MTARPSFAIGRYLTLPIGCRRATALKRSFVTLERAFYERDTLLVARELLGKIIVTRTAEGVTSGRIVETEGYHGDDAASQGGRA